MNDNPLLQTTPAGIKLYELPGDPTHFAQIRRGTGRYHSNLKELKMIAEIHLANQHGNHPMFVGPLRLRVWFCMAMTPQHIRYQVHQNPHPYKPDIADMMKFVQMISEGLIYKNDFQIVNSIAYKLYDQTPRTVFVVSEINEYSKEPWCDCFPPYKKDQDIHHQDATPRTFNNVSRSSCSVRKNPKLPVD